MKDDIVIGLDIAKSVFHACVMSKEGRVVERKRLLRREVLEFVCRFGSGTVAIESCGGSSYWAREFAARGFEVKLIPAQYVKPFVKREKNDVVDAEAICEAALRPQMRFVRPNTVTQQDLQNLHRVRERLVKQKTALGNQIRGLLLEYGIVIPQGTKTLTRELASLLDLPDADRALWKNLFAELREEFLALLDKIAHYDRLLLTISREHPVCQQLQQLSGVGPTISTAIVAAVNNAHDFKNGRQFAAWLGIVPGQHSTGGKVSLRGITKRGDKYLRKLLIQGVRSELRAKRLKNNAWLSSLKERRGAHKAAVALANKNARKLWAILVYGENYKQLKAIP